MRNSGAYLRRSKMFAMVCKGFIVIGWIFVRESYFLEIKMMAGEGEVDGEMRGMW